LGVSLGCHLLKPLWNKAQKKYLRIVKSCAYTSGMETRTYRNYTIIKTDTGGRRMGREVWYKTTCGKFAAETLKALKQKIDLSLDSDQAEVEAIKAKVFAALNITK
jgi:hypothetical protein